MAFSERYEKYLSDIKVTALSQRIIGLDYDDVVSEMLTCLWKADQTYKPGDTTFGAYWWSIWQNRKRDLIAYANAQKRPREAIIGDLRYLPKQPVYYHLRWPQPPSYADELEQKVWHLLASGEPVKTVIERCGITRRRYYDIVGKWKEDAQIRTLLRQRDTF